MKHTRLVLLALPLLLAAGCQVPGKTNLPTPTANIDKSDGPGAPSIAAYTYADKYADKNIDRCVFSFTYPELVRPHVWTPEDQPADPILDRANREIMRAFGLISPTGTVALNPEEVSNEFFDFCKGDMADMERTLGPESIAQMTYVEDSNFILHLLTPNIASISVDTYQYSGGAHGNPGLDAVTLDLATGQRLLLKDVIKNDQLQSVIQHAYAQILKNYEDGVFEESRTEINTIVNDKNVMSETDQRTKFGDTSNFFLTGEGLMFFWNVYEITPYVAGQPMAFIPWNELDGKLLIKRP